MSTDDKHKAIEERLGATLKPADATPTPDLPDKFLPKGAEVTETKDIEVDGKVVGKLHLVDTSKVEDDRRDRPDVLDEEVDLLAVAEGVVAGVQLDGVRVPEVKDPDLSDFPITCAEDVAALMRYIETNGLQDTQPWATTYLLYKALMAYGAKHP
jgi:hypothetical protein